MKSRTQCSKAFHKFGSIWDMIPDSFKLVQTRLLVFSVCEQETIFMHDSSSVPKCAEQIRIGTLVVPGVDYVIIWNLWTRKIHPYEFVPCILAHFKLSIKTRTDFQQPSRSPIIVRSSVNVWASWLDRTLTEMGSTVAIKRWSLLYIDLSHYTRTCWNKPYQILRLAPVSVGSKYCTKIVTWTWIRFLKPIKIYQIYTRQILAIPS